MRTRFSTGTEGQSFIASRRTALAVYLPDPSRVPMASPFSRAASSAGSGSWPSCRATRSLGRGASPTRSSQAGRAALREIEAQLARYIADLSSDGQSEPASRTMSLGGRAPGLWAIGGRVNIGAANHPSSPGRLRDALGLAFRSTLRNAASDRSIRAALRSRK